MARDEAGFRKAIASSKTASGRLTAVARWMFAEQRQTEHMLRDAVRFMTAEHQRTLFGHFQGRLFAQIHAVLDAGVSSGESRKHDTEFSTWAFMGLLSEFASVQQWTQHKDLAKKLVELFGRGVFT